MTWLVSNAFDTVPPYMWAYPQLYGLPQVGDTLGGGYFAGTISHTANGVPTHALIVAPKATGGTGTGYPMTTNLAWKASNTTTLGTDSTFDGAANTASMVTAGLANHSAAQFCVGLNIGGFTDWYLPSRYELDIAYFNLKPSTGANNTSSGANIYAVPQRNSNWTTAYPAQTALEAFNTGAEAFVANSHWSSSQLGQDTAHSLSFASGFLAGGGKIALLSVRAFRRIAL